MIAKLVPSVERAEGWAFTVPEFVTIVMDCTFVPNEPMFPVTPPMVAKFVELTAVLSVPQLTVPKFASGRIPPEYGASVIHSAELRWAEFTFAEVENVLPVVTSVSVTVKLLPENFTSAETLSPGFIVRPLMVKDG